MKEGRRRSHYAWKIVLACVLLRLGTGGATGAAQAFTGFVSVPILIDMWFRKKNGTALGIVNSGRDGEASALCLTFRSGFL